MSRGGDPPKLAYVDFKGWQPEPNPEWQTEGDKDNRIKSCQTESGAYSQKQEEQQGQSDKPEPVKHRQISKNDTIGFPEPE